MRLKMSGKWWPLYFGLNVLTNTNMSLTSSSHDDVIKWKHFPRHWPFVRRIHRSPVNSPHKGQWSGALLFSLICAWINAWVNNRDDRDDTIYWFEIGVTKFRLLISPLDTFWFVKRYPLYPLNHMLILYKCQSSQLYLLGRLSDMNVIYHK